MKTYTTVQGDMWDSIAFQQMGSEKHISALLEANPEHIDTFIFPAGTVLQIPDVAPDEPAALPPWRKST